MNEKLKNLERAIFAKRCAGRISFIREAWAEWITEHQKKWWRRLWEWVIR